MTERYQCTKDSPWTSDKGKYVEHDNIHQIGEQRDGWPSGDIVTYECRNCGHRWDQELPQ